MAINIPIITILEDSGIRAAKAAFGNFKTAVSEAQGGLGKIKAGSKVALEAVAANAGLFAIADMAGKGGGRQSRREAKYQRPNFGRALPGDPSRFMWKNAEKTIGSVEREMNDTIKRVVREANQQLMKVRP